MKATSSTVLSIRYAGLLLPVLKNARGEDATPLKPIVDLFGLRWAQQREKVTNSPYLSRFLGVCTLDIWCADGQKREQTCILLSRVAAFLMSINSDKVRSHGNTAAADFLEQKIEEWADALHDYEEMGVAVNLNHARAQEMLRKQRASFAQMIAVKNRATAPNDRQALSHLLHQMAHELDVPYQPDLALAGAKP
jgi:hypothetical protein